jgi:hypothetical protein
MPLCKLLHNLLNVRVQIANKMGLQESILICVYTIVTAVTGFVSVSAETPFPCSLGTAVV